MKQLIIYIHGKGGTAGEAAHYMPLFPDSDVIGFDYKARNPWEAKAELSSLYDEACRGYDSVILIANSIGAYFSMSALAEKSITKAFFISPIVDMEKLITNMMMWAGVTEDALQERKENPTQIGEALSWEYQCYVRCHPNNWSIPTYILYGGKDTLTSRESVSDFAKRIGAALTVMEDGEHWFHTDLQMEFLDRWLGDLI